MSTINQNNYVQVYVWSGTNLTTCSESDSTKSGD